jgi:hypothetical protein
MDTNGLSTCHGATAPGSPAPASDKDGGLAPVPAQALPALPLDYAPAEPRIPLLGPRRVLPVDQAMATFFIIGLLGVTCMCIVSPVGNHGVPVVPVVLLVTVAGSGYLLVRIGGERDIPVGLRVQLITAALLCVAATVTTAWIYFHPRYRLRPHPPSLYVAAATVGLTLAWFAAVKRVVLHRRRAAAPVADASSAQD